MNNVVVAAKGSWREAKLANHYCDGRGDEEELQRAIDSLGEKGGIVYPIGEFSVSGVINLNSNVHLQGNGGKVKHG